MTPFRCPCCWQAYARPDPQRVVEYLPVSGIGQAMLNILVQRFGCAVPTDYLLECLWAGTADGPPPTARKAIHVRAYQLRKRLAPHGLTIHGTSVTGSYRLEWISPRTDRGTKKGELLWTMS